MKKLIMVMALAVSAHSIAGSAIMEFDHAQEVKCNKEAQNLGCLNGSGEEDLQLIVCTSVEICGCDDVVSGVCEGADGDELGSLTR